MTLTGNLALRMTVILVAGFVLLQIAMAAVLIVPSAERPRWPFNLPEPAQARRLVEAIERAPPGDRHDLVSALNGGLFTLRLAPFLPATGAPVAGPVAQAYRDGLGGRRIHIRPGRGGLARLAPSWIGPGRLLTPPRIAIELRDGSALIVDGRPSAAMRSFLRRRAMAAAIGGLILLLVLALAVRRSTKPLVRLTRRVETAGADLRMDPLPVEGPRETRALAAAFNGLQARIGGLVEERTRMLAAIAHDMRTYLTRLRLRGELVEDEALRTKIAADLDEMSTLLDDSLLLAAPEGQASGPAEMIDLGSELRHLVLIRGEMGDEVELEPPGELPPVRASRLAVRRAFANLVDNGIRYGGGAVTISARRVGTRVELVFADRGPGVPPEVLARLGEPFYRAEPSRARRTAGAGLGLAIVKALVAAQGGSVTFANREDGGFEARISLPVAAAS